MRHLSLQVGFVAVAVFLTAQVSRTSAQGKPKIRFDSDGKFKLVNFADLHYGEHPGTDQGRAQDGNSTRVIREILGYETPDFVVFTGDLITGDIILVNSTGFIKTLLVPLVEGGYRWASTYGNHDNGAATTREEIFATESQYPNCYTMNDGSQELAGLTNYYLPIYPSVENGTDETPALILWFFDSRGGFDPTGVKPSNVDESVVEWFIQQNANLTQKWGLIPALAFFHIPTIDYEDVQLGTDIPSRPDCVGLVDEAVVPQNRDTGFMDALVNSPVMTTFVGHDHGNAWCCPYKTLEICYNKHTGYGGYSHGWSRGARVLQLSQDDLTHRLNYIRLENGTIIDEYPEGSETPTTPPTTVEATTLPTTTPPTTTPSTTTPPTTTPNLGSRYNSYGWQILLFISWIVTICFQAI